MRRVLRDVERAFGERFVPAVKGPGGVFEFPWVPEMETFEREGRMFVRIDLPGLKKEEVTVTVVGDTLTVEGERKHETEQTKKNWFMSERTYGRFFRTVTLPEGVEAAAVKATFTDGVLEIGFPLPKAAAAVPPYKVPIEAAHPAPAPATVKVA
jgi:HSP20 family protein